MDVFAFLSRTHDACRLCRSKRCYICDARHKARKRADNRRARRIIRRIVEEADQPSSQHR